MAERTYEIIEDAADCTIKQFIRATFEGKLKVLIVDGNPSEEEYKILEPKLKNAFEYIYAQYVDISGLYRSQEFEILAYIDSLDKRIWTMKRFVELQRTFMSHFDMPFLPGFAIAEKYGHRLVWNPEYPDLFKKQLDAIPTKESRYSIKVNEKVKELVELRKKSITKEHSILESRKEFISMLNRLQQHKFVINKSETTVEELGLMIKDYRDQIQTEKMNGKFVK